MKLHPDKRPSSYPSMLSTVTFCVSSWDTDPCKRLNLMMYTQVVKLTLRTSKTIMITCRSTLFSSCNGSWRWKAQKEPQREPAEKLQSWIDRDTKKQQGWLMTHTVTEVTLYFRSCTRAHARKKISFLFSPRNFEQQWEELTLLSSTHLEK